MITNTNPLVSIIILNYNGKEVLVQCLDSIFSSTYSPIEVIVVDNCSTDGSADGIEKMYNIKLVKNKTNLGFSAGNNVGIRIAHGEYILLLNNDTVVHSDMISEIVSNAIQNEADFCQPKILVFNDRSVINSTGLDIHVAGFGILRGGWEQDLGQYDDLEEVCGLHGTCILVKREALKKVGLLDEMFFSFGEDTDWSWRAQLLGLKLFYVPKAVLYHKCGHQWARTSNFPLKIYYSERNRLIMVLSNYTKRSLILLLPILIFTEIFTLGYGFMKRIPHAKIRSYSDIIKMRKYITNRRKHIQKYRINGDRLVLRKFVHVFKQKLFVRHDFIVNKLYGLLYNLIYPYIY